MSRASGQVAPVGEFEALFTARSIYTRPARESEQANDAGSQHNRRGAWLSNRPTRTGARVVESVRVGLCF